VAFAGPLAFYIATLTPGVAFWDIGEMQTVPYLLGIPHPTGFPLFLLGGWLSSHMLPFGDPAWRISLFSALAAAGSAWLLWYLVAGVTRSGLAGLAAAIAFAGGHIVWTRAIRAEVHDLVLFCSTLAIVAAWRAGAGGSPRALWIAAVASGLGLATHPATLFIVPSVVVLAWPELQRARASERLRAAALLLGPLLLYAYFPLRSAFVELHGLDPNHDLGLSGSALFDDGSPSSPKRFYEYVSGATFRPGLAFGASVTAAGLAKIVAFWSGVMLKEFSIQLLAFAAIGLAILGFTKPRLAAGFVTLLILTAPFAANYAVEVDAERYALPALWIVVCCAAVGVYSVVFAILRERGRPTGWFCAATLLVTLWPNAATVLGDVRDRTAFNDARGIGPGIVRHTKDGALIVATWNFATPLTYDRYVVQTLGSRRVVCGWPPSFRPHLADWRRRFGRVYVVVSSQYDVTTLGRTVYTEGRWQLAELR
jgi:4-amino-4-deoxy-L-arabinose transferase-like glycosyltransferase